MSSAKELKKSGRNERNIKEAAVLAVQTPHKTQNKNIQDVPITNYPN